MVLISFQYSAFRVQLWARWLQRVAALWVLITGTWCFVAPPGVINRLTVTKHFPLFSLRVELIAPVVRWRRSGKCHLPNSICRYLNVIFPPIRLVLPGHGSRWLILIAPFSHETTSLSAGLVCCCVFVTLGAGPLEPHQPRGHMSDHKSSSRMLTLTCGGLFYD